MANTLTKNYSQTLNTTPKLIYPQQGGFFSSPNNSKLQIASNLFICNSDQTNNILFAFDDPDNPYTTASPFLAYSPNIILFAPGVYLKWGDSDGIPLNALWARAMTNTASLTCRLG